MSDDTEFAQMVFRDVIRQVAVHSANGVEPRKLSGPLFTRVTFYGLAGVILIGVAVGSICKQPRRFDVPTDSDSI